MKAFLVALALTAVVAVGPEASAQNNLANPFQGFTQSSNEPIQVEADSLEVTEGEAQRVSVFRGNVTVRRGQVTLKAAAITIYSAAGEGKPEQEALDRIEASGKVYINAADQTATGDGAAFDLKAEVATVTGNVVLTQGGNVISGDRLTVDLKTGRASIQHTAGQRVRGIFTPGAAETLRTER